MNKTTDYNAMRKCKNINANKYYVERWIKDVQTQLKCCDMVCRLLKIKSKLWITNYQNKCQ